MGDTDIAWTSKVWNVTRGCRRISAGCGGPKREGGCYAERQAYRFSGLGQAYEGLVKLTANGPRWTGVGRFVPEKLAEPFGWSKPQRVFVDSMSDLFFEEFTNEQIAAVFGVMAACPQHTFQVLTKRPKRMRQWFAWVAGLDCDPWTECHAAALALDTDDTIHRKSGAGRGRPWPLPNVHLGVSTENQDAANERIPELLATPAVVRFLSIEPMLGPVNLTLHGSDIIGWDEDWKYDTLNGCEWANGSSPSLGWVIQGVESGPGARPCDLAWVRSLRDQCRAAGVPFFVKQLMVDGKLRHDIADFPEDLRIQEFPTP